MHGGNLGFAVEGPEEPFLGLGFDRAVWVLMGVRLCSAYIRRTLIWALAGLRRNVLLLVEAPQ